MKISEKRLEDLARLETSLGFKFKDISRLHKALIHSSYINENDIDKNFYNERLEFLGDAVLELVVSDYLYKNYPNSPEGILTKKRAQIVCENSFGQFGRLLNLGSYLLLGKGEELNGGRNKKSIIADAFEAICGAIYLDGGYDFIVAMIANFISNHLVEDNEDKFIDYKTIFQEYMFKNQKTNFRYKLISESGPSHDKKFLVSLINANKTISEGEGKSIKKAEQDAASKALEKLHLI